MGKDIGSTTYDTNILHAEHGHPSEVIAWAIGKAMGLNFKATFKPCEDCALEKAKKSDVSQKAVECSNILGERLFFDISLSSTPTLKVSIIACWSYNKSPIVCRDIFQKKSSNEKSDVRID